MLNGLENRNWNLKKHLKQCISFLQLYEFISEMYIIEYFTGDHWQKLPESWQVALSDVKAEELADLLKFKSKIKSCSKVWPLSLLAFFNCANILQIPRNQCSFECKHDDNFRDNKLFRHMFQKHVNLKKQHEISVLSEVIAQLYEDANCQCVIDVGAGQGHLSRLLTLGFGIPLCALEHEELFRTKAKKFDEEAKLHFNKHLLKINRSNGKLTFPHHLKFTVSPDVDAEQFLEDIRIKLQGTSFDSSLKQCLLTGLHACGDLSAAMVRLFKESEDICALVSVACCYMKLTTEDEDVSSRVCTSARINYPMSAFAKSISSHKLSYKARELACHAVEDYCTRLKENGPRLKMHCYRAVLEYLIRKHYPSLIRPGVQTVKKAYLLPFDRYVEKAMDKLKLPHLDKSEVINEKIDEMLGEWNKVMVVFTLSLVVAPVIETVMLLDRLIYLSENGIDGKLVSVFDPSLSPRCFAIIAKKSK